MITRTEIIHADKLKKSSVKWGVFSHYKCVTQRYIYIYAQYNQFILNKTVRFGSSYFNIRAEIDTSMTVVKSGRAYVGNGLRSSVNRSPNQIVQLLVTVWHVVIEKGVLYGLNPFTTEARFYVLNAINWNVGFKFCFIAIWHGFPDMYIKVNNGHKWAILILIELKFVRVYPSLKLHILFYST